MNNPQLNRQKPEDLWALEVLRVAAKEGTGFCLCEARNTLERPLCLLIQSFSPEWHEIWTRNCRDPSFDNPGVASWMSYGVSVSWIKCLLNALFIHLSELATLFPKGRPHFPHFSEDPKGWVICPRDRAGIRTKLSGSCALEGMSESGFPEPGIANPAQCLYSKRNSRQR